MQSNKVVRIPFAIALFGLMAISFSCQKLDPLEGRKPLLQASGSFSGVSVSNEMLVFTNDAKVAEVLNSIQDLENELRSYLNTTYGDSYPTLARYNAIIEPDGPFDGQNPINGYDLPTYTGSEIEKIDDDPIKYLFEEAFNFDGFRRHLVDEEYQLLADGTFNGAGNDPDDHFIPDDYLRLILNDKLEIQVGSKVYKIVSSTSILEMDAPTTEEITMIRAEFAPPISYTEVTEQPNPGVCYGNPTVQSYNNIVVVDFQEPLSAQACVADFSYTVDQVLLTQVSFTNTSTGNYTSLNWNFGDGNVSTSSNPTHTYSQNGTYYVTLTLNDGVNICDAETKTVTISSGCVADFYYTTTGAMVDFVDDSRSNNSSATVIDWTWDFGDGSAIITSLANPSHTYALSGTYQVCLIISTSDNCTENHCETISVVNECCKTNKTFRDGSGSSPTHNPGNTRGYKGKLWITSLPFYRRVGSKTKCYRQKNNGNWVQEKADYISTGVVGNVYNGTCLNVIAAPNWVQPENDSKTSSWSSGDFGQSIKTRQEELGGTFYVDDNNTIYSASGLLIEPQDCN
jgi:PKD repeat protein